MPYIAPTTMLNTAMVPTTMGSTDAVHEALGDVAGLLTSIGGGVANYFNAQALANQPNADLQAALLAQQQAEQTQEAMLIGAGIVAVGIFVILRMNKKKSSKPKTT